MKSKIIIPALVLCVSFATVTSCNRFLDITPTDKVIPRTTEDFRGLLTRAYHVFPQHKALVNLRTDEVKTTSSSESLKSIFTWSDTNPDPGSMEYPYATFYHSIFYSNYIIENANKYVESGKDINQIMGEAYALRAYNYFELINLYAPEYNSNSANSLAVPLITGINLEGDFSKAKLEEVYTQIFSDIARADGLMQTESFDIGLNYRFTKTALQAFKARVHQYRGEWGEALKAADNVLAKKSDLENFSQYKYLPCDFKSKESIMNLDFIVNSTANSFSRVSDNHINLFDQVNDLRFSKYFKKNGSNWQTTKYSASNDFKCTFRVGEIMLIKAEALAKLKQESQSKEVLLSLASKRYNTVGYENFKSKITSLSGDSYYAELLNERARETSYEGLRWFDLRRTTKPEIIHVFSGKTYTLKNNDERYTLPFPKEARMKNPSL